MVCYVDFWWLILLLLVLVVCWVLLGVILVEYENLIKLMVFYNLVFVVFIRLMRMELVEVV